GGAVPELTRPRGRTGVSPRPNNAAFADNSGNGHRAHDDSCWLRPRSRGRIAPIANEAGTAARQGTAPATRGASSTPWARARRVNRRTTARDTAPVDRRQGATARVDARRADSLRPGGR